MDSNTTANTTSTAILLGASGSVGQALLTELVRCGQFKRVIAVTRRPLNLPPGAGVEEHVVADMAPESLTHAVVDALRDSSGEAIGFSALGVGAGTARLSLEQHRAVDVALNGAFAQGLKASGKVRHLAYLSAVGANPLAPTSGSGAAGMGRYARVKGEAEAAVQAAGPGVVSIFRPSLIVGSQHTPRLLPAVFALLTPLIPANYRAIRTEEIAQAMVAATLRRPTSSAIYHYAEMKKLIVDASK